VASEQAQIAHVWRRLGFGPAPGDVEAGVAAGGTSAVIEDLLSRPTTAQAQWQWPTDQSNPPSWNDMVRWMDRLFSLWIHGDGAVQERVSWILNGVTVAGITNLVLYADLKDHQNRLRAWPAAPSYKALLSDIANTSAMQKYLTNIFSQPPHPNENLARELMELFSLGVTHPLTGADNYTENDVKEIARALTGYRWNGQPGASSVWWDSALWDSGDKTFLGASRGAAKLPAVMDAIVAHDSYRYFIPQRMYRELVGVDPSPSTLAELADVWGTDGDLKALVAHIAGRPEFVADAAIGNRVKSPVDLLVSSVRVLGFTDISQFSLWQLGATMRQSPVAPPDVAGWKGEWLHPTHVLLWSQVNGWLCWSDHGPTPAPKPATPVAQQSPTLRRLLAEATTATATDMALQFAGLYDVSPGTRNAVNAYVQAGAWDWYRVCGTMQLIFNSPEFMVS
jgi:uncharacterized protein (DUF1800 family)